jgi:hypothetical protein
MHSKIIWAALLFATAAHAGEAAQGREAAMRKARDAVQRKGYDRALNDANRRVQRVGDAYKAALLHRDLLQAVVKSR